MPLKGRSPDDLPLAAYTSGRLPDADDEPSDPELVDEEAGAEPAESMAAPTVPEWAALPLGVPEDEPRSVHIHRDGEERPAFADLVRNPRAHVRDPRLLLTGVVAVGVLMLGVSLLGGGGPAPATGANPSPSAPPAAAAATAPTAGNASIDLNGKLKATYTLLGRTGIGPPAQSRIDSTWGDSVGNALGLAGAVSSGTRTTDATFVLTWTVLVEGLPVTFTSKAGECTVGMAVQPRSVTGSFVCKKLKSDDGEHTVGARGTYRT